MGQNQESTCQHLAGYRNILSFPPLRRIGSNSGRSRQRSANQYSQPAHCPRTCPADRNNWVIRVHRRLSATQYIVFPDFSISHKIYLIESKRVSLFSLGGEVYTGNRNMRSLPLIVFPRANGRLHHVPESPGTNPDRPLPTSCRGAPPVYQTNLVPFPDTTCYRQRIPVARDASSQITPRDASQNSDPPSQSTETWELRTR